MNMNRIFSSLLMVAAASSGLCMAQSKVYVMVAIGPTASTSQCAFMAQSLHTGFTQSVNFANGGVTLTRPQESQITIVKDADNCSSTLLKNLFSASPGGIPTVTISLMGNTQTPIETITLTNVFVTSVTDGSADGEVTYPLNENVTLFYETITIADQIAKTTVTCTLLTNTCR